MTNRDEKLERMRHIAWHGMGIVRTDDGKPWHPAEILELVDEVAKLRLEAARLEWLLNKVGVEKDANIRAKAFVWMPGGSTRLDDDDKLASLAAIDYAIEHGPKP